jgi:two-component system cell cycle response regulator DivK
MMNFHSDRNEKGTMTHALIIDDNQSNINVLGMLLDGEGCSYTEIRHPCGILDTIASSGPIDVIFLDLEFPTNNGFTILEQLRGFDALNGIPIVAYSVHTSEVEAARSAGFDGFLGKPLDADRFADQWQHILEGEAIWEIVS